MIFFALIGAIGALTVTTQYVYEKFVKENPPLTRKINPSRQKLDK